jgi:hypothetical protein
MASPRFDANIVTAAKRLHDNRATAHLADESAMRYTEALLVAYQNQAIRDTIRDTYLQHGDRFDRIMPEMSSESTDVTLTSGVGNVPTDCWIVLEAAKSDYSIYYTRIDVNPLKVKANRDALMLPSNSRPVFYQAGRTIVVLPTTVTGPARLWYIQQPQDMTVANATDIPISPMWDGQIIERMVAFGLADAKSSVAI